MANKDWGDIPYVAGDCVRDTTQWNNMVDYIRHSSCTDFTIYKTCPSTTQTHKFTWEAGNSIIEGGAAGGEDLAIRANSNDASPEIALMGAGDIDITGDMTFPFDNAGIKFGAGDDVHMYWDGTYLKLDPVAAGHENFSILFAAGITTINGGDNVGDDLMLKANINDNYSNIQINGASKMTYSSHTYHAFRTGAVTISELSYAANVTTFQGGAAAGDDLLLKANDNDAGANINLEGAGDVALNPQAGSFVKFGTHVGTGDVVSNGHVVIQDSGGTPRKLMTTA